MEWWVPREGENKKQPSQISTSSLHDLPSGPLRSSRILSKELLALKTAGNASRLLPSSLLYRVPHWVFMYGVQRCLALKMDSKHSSETLPRLCQVFQKPKGPAVQRRNPRAQLFGRRVYAVCPARISAAVYAISTVSMMLVCATTPPPPPHQYTHKSQVSGLRVLAGGVGGTTQ